MRVILIHSPSAGDREHDRPSLLRLMAEAGHDAQYFSSKEASWRTAVKSEAADIIAVAGGDGTVAEVARTVLSEHPPIAVLPAGTANNIATGLGIADAAVEGLVARWRDARLQPFDIGVVRSKDTTFRFVESVGAGLLADGIAHIDSDPSDIEQLNNAQDRVAAAIEIHQHLLAELPPVHIELRLDGQDRSGEYLLLEILNFGIAGPNLRLAPLADPADGSFDVVLVDESQRGELIEHLPLYRASPAHAPRLPTFKAREISLSCGDRHIHFDDELRNGAGTDTIPGITDISIEPHVVNFLV
jgi:diacylglycerol kinase (ATP)